MNYVPDGPPRDPPAPRSDAIPGATEIPGSVVKQKKKKSHPDGAPGRRSGAEIPPGRSSNKWNVRKIEDKNVDLTRHVVAL